MIYASDILAPIIGRLTLAGELRIYYRDFAYRLREVGKQFPKVIENIEFKENSLGVFSKEIAGEMTKLSDMGVIFQAEDIKGPYIMMSYRYAKKCIETYNNELKEIIPLVAENIYNFRRKEQSAQL